VLLCMEGGSDGITAAFPQEHRRRVAVAAARIQKAAATAPPVYSRLTGFAGDFGSAVCAVKALEASPVLEQIRPWLGSGEHHWPGGARALARPAGRASTATGTPETTRSRTTSTIPAR
jgi:hypothetical protein